MDDADSYDVDQRPADGSWTGASCNGGDSRVTSEECEASGLTRGTDYSFRVRANPDSDDDTLEQSAWSSTATARTSGSTPTTPITGADDGLNITWESDATSITWFWQAASDTRITNLYVVLTPPDHERQACPALNDTTTPWQEDAPYAIAHKVTGLTDGGGDVRGLCVRRTWMDDQDNVQYGPVSVAWAAASPGPPTNTVPTGEIDAGPKDDDQTLKTTAIDWFVKMDKGFTYEVRTVAATIASPSELGSCADEGTGDTKLSVNQDNAHERFRLSTLQTYTEYKACVRASNDQGDSGWTEIVIGNETAFQTLPSAPSGLRGTLKNVTTDDNKASQVDVSVTWTFGASDRTPVNPGGYNAYTTMSDSEALTKDDCATTLTAASVIETGSGFSFGPLAHTFTRDGAADSENKTGRVLACVQAKLNGRVGPWAAVTSSISVPKQ